MFQNKIFKSIIIISFFCWFFFFCIVRGKSSSFDWNSAKSHFRNGWHFYISSIISLWITSNHCNWKTLSANCPCMAREMIKFVFFCFDSLMYLIRTEKSINFSFQYVWNEPQESIPQECTGVFDGPAHGPWDIKKYCKNFHSISILFLWCLFINFFFFFDVERNEITFRLM